MKKFICEDVKVETLSRIVCDRCKKHYKGRNFLEIPEFLHIDTTAGYGSVFGDTNRMELDLCQYCVKDVLGQWIRITEQ